MTNQASISKSKPSILIVDDESGLREILKDEFEALGWQVLDAGGGNEAFELLKKNRVSIVLSDVRMPLGDGIQLLENIQKNIQPRPVVFMVTGFADIPDQKLVSMGAQAVINKPYDLDDLIGMIVDFFNKHIK